MIVIAETVPQKVARIVCPKCKTRIPRIGLVQDSKIDGLSFTCKCGYCGLVKTN